VEYVKQEAKVVFLLECLQKTHPPVLIFAEKKQDVDAIHEYLLLKGVEAVAIHGGKGAVGRICVMLINVWWVCRSRRTIAIGGSIPQARERRAGCDRRGLQRLGLPRHPARHQL
jgi:hypothetical protein